MYKVQREEDFHMDSGLPALKLKQTSSSRLRKRKEYTLIQAFKEKK